MNPRTISNLAPCIAVAAVAFTFLMPDAAYAQAGGGAGSGAATAVQGKLLAVGTDVARVIRNVLWGGAVIAAILSIGALLFGKIEVKRFIQIGVACVLLGVIGGIVTIFTGSSANVSDFDNGATLDGGNFGGGR